MTSASNNAEQLILSSRQSLVSFNTLTHPSEHLERTFKMEPVDNPGGKERKRKVEPGTPSLFAYSVAEFDECSRCEKARSAGLDAWMDHLGHVHTFPSRWPSSKIDDGLMDKDRPYTSVVDSHKKRKAAGIPRPLNSFMIFAQYIRRLTLSSFPDAPNVHISQQVGKLWRNLSNDFREVYAKESRRLQNLHSLEFPDYKYQPRRRLRTPEGDELGAHSSQACQVNPPPQPNHHCLDEFPDNTSSSCQPKPTLPTKFDPDERPDFTSGFLNFNDISHASNMDTLTSIQEADSHRDVIKSEPQQQDDSNLYQPPFNYANNTDGRVNRLSWSEERLMEPLGEAASQVQPPVVTSTDDLFSTSDHWYQYQREGSFGDPLSLPGIETWTFSGSSI